MAYNIEIDAEFMPVRDMDEQFVMRRDGVEHKVHVRGLGEFKGKGHLILTTKRLVFVNRDMEMPEFKSFSFPLRETHQEKFEEGMAGRFHIDAHCKPHMGMIPNQAEFKLWFNMGGALVFQHFYKRCLIRAKEGMMGDAMMMEFRAAEFQNELMGFGDAGMETTVYINQGADVAVMQQEPMMEQPMMQQPMMQQDNQMMAGMIGMQLDVGLDGEMVPIKDMDEEFVMRRNGVEFNVNVNREGDYQGEGHLMLTTKRLILVNRGMTIFKSFSMPLVHIHDEFFKEGMMGKFHVEGKCKPGMLSIKHKAEFNIKFNQLGAIHFQEVLKMCLIRAKEQRDAQAMMMELRGPEFQARFMGFGDMGQETVVFIQPNGQVDVVQQQPMMQQPMMQEAMMQDAMAVQRTDNAIFDALAIDCALDGDFMPIKDMNEEFLLRRNFIEFHINVRDRGDFRGKGHLVLTTKRLILVNRENPEWAAFSLPNVHVFNERFELGMGGRFNIDAHCRNDRGLLPHPAHYKVWFNQGGADRFSHLYKHVILRSKEMRDCAAMMIEMRDPMFNQRVMGFPPCQEETLLYIDGSVMPMQQPMMEQPMMQQPMMQQPMMQQPMMQQPMMQQPMMQQPMMQEAMAVQRMENVAMIDALTVDCPIDGDFMPVKDMNEEFVLRRNFIEFHVKVRGREDFKGKGHLILTTKRLVIVNRENPLWKTWSFPLIFTFNERFEQGQMGRFHIDAHCKNDMGMLPHPAHFKIWFNQGGALRFQHVYRHILIRAKERIEFGAIMAEMRQPMFIEQCNRFGAVQEETVYFMGGEAIVVPVQQPIIAPVQQMVAPVQAAFVQQAVVQQQVRAAECVMTRDCMLGGDMMPIRESDEEFVMRRNGVEFHIHIRGIGHLKAHGHAILTTKRLVLVNRAPAEFKSFQFPLVHTHNEQFKAGMRGRFHCEATVKPLRSAFGHPANLKLWFSEGGALIFQNFYKRCLIRAKEQLDSAAIMMELRGPQFQGELARCGPATGETVVFVQTGGASAVVVEQVPVKTPGPLVQAAAQKQNYYQQQRVNQQMATQAAVMQPQQKGCCTIF